MRSSTMFTVACAGLAAASPIINKKAIVYDIVTDVVVVTVTDGAEPAQATTTTVQAAASTSVVYSAPSAESSSFVASVAAATAAEAEAVVSTVVVASTWASTWVSTSAVTQATVEAAATTSAAAVVSVETPSTTAVAASTVAAAAADASPTDYESTATWHHNVHRANHSAPGLTYDSTLAGYAATLAAGCVFEHNLDIGGGGYGQNIASVGSTDASTYTAMQMLADATTNMWYNGEVGEYLSSFYGVANPDFSNFDAWGHFSQLVWKSSTTVGCATQKCAAGTMYSGMESWFTVCNYGPEGNMGGEYGENVLPSLGHATISF